MYVAQERRAYILRLLQQRGSIRSASLARELGVTDETIRTDLVDLQAQGLLQRVHGGARYTLPVGGKDASTRPDCQLAQLALSHIKDDACIYLDDDPLALVLVSQLHGVKATLVTPSLKILSQLTAASLPHQVICPGGVLNKECGLLDSQEARDSLLTNMKLDVALLCPPAVRGDLAAYHHPTRAAWAQAAAEAADKCLIMVPSQALYAHAPHAFPLPEGNSLITENNLPPHFRHPDVELIPYISEEDLQQSSGFDY